MAANDLGSAVPSGADIAGPEDVVDVLVSSAALGVALAELSPRVRVHRWTPGEGLPAGEATRARVWVPPVGAWPVVGVLADVVAALPELRLVQLQSAGAELVADRLPGHVVLCNARGAHTPATAEWTVAAMLAAQRGLSGFLRDAAAGRWAPRTERSLVGARVLVLGAGDIGRRIGRMLDGFDVELTFVARTARDGVRSLADLPELLPAADVVVLVVPLTAETTGLVDAAFLAAMPDGALLVNVARGPVVVTDALLAELNSGRLRAALDVTDPEPLPAGHPLWSAPNLLLTPHVAGTVPDVDERATAAVVAQLRRVLAGDPLENVVDAY